MEARDAARPGRELELLVGLLSLAVVLVLVLVLRDIQLVRRDIRLVLRDIRLGLCDVRLGLCDVRLGLRDLRFRRAHLACSGAPALTLEPGRLAFFGRSLAPLSHAPPPD
jgi:hypothetical protein